MSCAVDSTIVTLTNADAIKTGIDLLSKEIIQEITVSSGLLSFSIIFADKLKNLGKESFFVCLVISWLFLFASIMIGLLALFRLTGALLPENGILDFKDKIENAKTISVCQLICFVLAILAILIYGTIGYLFPKIKYLLNRFRKKTNSKTEPLLSDNDKPMD